LSPFKRTQKKTATQVKSSILTEGKSEIERLTATAKSQIGTIESRVRKQISDYVVTLALQRITMQLEGKLNSNLQQQIIDRNISKLA
jgi:F0F1-type ATP synthase membrane subunit b/b'